MQSNLTSKLGEMEERIQETEKQHQIELQEKEAACLESLAQLKTTLNEQDVVIEKLRERLLMTKRENHCSFLEAKYAEDKRENNLDKLKAELQKATDRIEVLERQEELDAAVCLQVEVLQGQLDQAIIMNEELTRKYEYCKFEYEEAESSLEESKKELTRLQEQVSCLESEVKREIFFCGYKLANVHLLALIF